MKLGLSCMNIPRQYGYEKGMKLIKESGFDSVDISLTDLGKPDGDLYSASEDEFLTYFHGIKKICDDLELEISQTHGRLTTCVPDQQESDLIKRNSALDLKASAILGAPVCIFHSVKCKDWEFICLEPEFMLQKSKEFFGDFLTPLCAKYQVKFALETSGCTRLSTGPEINFMGDGRNLKKSFDMLESEYKSFCLDTGHSNEAHYYGGPTVQETVNILGKDIAALHLHDNQGFYDSHLIPMANCFGGIEWAKVFDALSEIGYKGVYNWELNLAYYGNYLSEALPFLGKFLRYFTENEGRM